MATIALTHEMVMAGLRHWTTKSSTFFSKDQSRNIILQVSSLIICTLVCMAARHPKSLNASRLRWKSTWLWQHDLQAQGVLLEVAAVSVLYCMCTLKLNVKVKVKVVHKAKRNKKEHPIQTHIHIYHAHRAHSAQAALAVGGPL
jgi:protein-S-isoprenylcysteine O-methyltransferase Ste14